MRSLGKVSVASLLAIVATAAGLYACSATESSPPPAGSDAGPSTDAPADQGTVPEAGPDAATPDGGVDADAGFAPTALGGRLVLWLEATPAHMQTDAGRVTTWTDQSGKSNHANQAASAREPLFTLDAGLGGKGALHFAGAQTLVIDDSASLQWGASDFGFYTVMRHTNTSANYGIAYGKWTNTISTPGFFLWAAYPSSNNYVTRMESLTTLVPDGGPYNDNVMRVVGVRKVGNRLELRVGGTAVVVNPDVSGYDITAANAAGNPSYVGGRDATNFQNLEGDIAEMLGIKGTVTDLEQTDLETYLKAKYGL